MWNNRGRHRFAAHTASRRHVNGSVRVGVPVAVGRLLRGRTDRKPKNILVARISPTEKVDCTKSSSEVRTRRWCYPSLLQPFCPSTLRATPNIYAISRTRGSAFAPFHPVSTRPFPSSALSSFLPSPPGNLASHHRHHRHPQASQPLLLFAGAPYPTTSLPPRDKVFPIRIPIPDMMPRVHAVSLDRPANRMLAPISRF